MYTVIHMSKVFFLLVEGDEEFLVEMLAKDDEAMFADDG